MVGGYIPVSVGRLFFFFFFLRLRRVVYIYMHDRRTFLFGARSAQLGSARLLFRPSLCLYFSQLLIAQREEVKERGWPPIDMSFAQGVAELTEKLCNQQHTHTRKILKEEREKSPQKNKNPETASAFALSILCPFLRWFDRTVSFLFALPLYLPSFVVCSSRSRNTEFRLEVKTKRSRRKKKVH